MDTGADKKKKKNFDLLEADIAVPIIDAAREAHGQGRGTFTCSAPTTTTDGNILALKRKNYGKTFTYDIGPLIDAIERIGWALTFVEHIPLVPVNIEISGTTLLYNEVRAHMIFRRKTT
ncbi:hypothetical protein MHJ85_07725 [Brevibacterium ravenspurgense]|uniref:hypothetical protein n=1 Tax=Brevibacterium ravenspurgense TaxID=479117 RepID=UPI001EF25B22|nr:hypothetical protein [Brevibacterium ravenspurgense]MCG7301143.1 hypothetical protein [Brevibacterium ravenspurgense]